MYLHLPFFCQPKYIYICICPFLRNPNLFVFIFAFFHQKTLTQIYSYLNSPKVSSKIYVFLYLCLKIIFVTNCPDKNLLGIKYIMVNIMRSFNTRQNWPYSNLRTKYSRERKREVSIFKKLRSALSVSVSAFAKYPQKVPPHKLVLISYCLIKTNICMMFCEHDTDITFI